MPQLRSPPAATKIWCNQINKQIFLKNEWILRDLWDYNKIFNSPGGEEKQGMTEELLKELIAEDFLNLVKDKPTDSRS